MSTDDKPCISDVFKMIDAALKSDPSVTKGKEGIYQFKLEGDEPGTYHMIIDDMEPRAVEGEIEDVQCTLIIDSDHFKDLIGGTLNPTAAFMGGKLKIKGNMGLALKLQTVLNSFSF